MRWARKLKKNMGDMRRAYSIFVGKLELNRKLGSP
jgi:hypothetical protein